ncbi:hypothetical protein [Brevibacillus marinus]|uniref:hypothetical protein n=1 Tax=Brevibacillus marinus TaxID=2496837 RepID=UPI000F8199B5|nr:hypothetical protein [Brevibacillus marinus]
MLCAKSSLNNFQKSVAKQAVKEYNRRQLEQALAQTLLTKKPLTTSSLGRFGYTMADRGAGRLRQTEQVRRDRWRLVEQTLSGAYQVVLIKRSKRFPYSCFCKRANPPVCRQRKRAAGKALSLWPDILGDSKQQSFTWGKESR